MSVRLRAGEFNLLGPLLGFRRDELAEIGGCHRQWHVAQLGKAGLGSESVVNPNAGLDIHSIVLF